MTEQKQTVEPKNLKELLNDPMTKAYDEFLSGGQGRKQFREIITKYFIQDLSNLEQPKATADVEAIMLDLIHSDLVDWEDTHGEKEGESLCVCIDYKKIDKIIRSHLTPKKPEQVDKYKIAIHLITEYENDTEFNKFGVSNKITDYEMWLRLKNSEPKPEPQAQSPILEECPFCGGKMGLVCQGNGEGFGCGE